MRSRFGLLNLEVPRPTSSQRVQWDERRSGHPLKSSFFLLLSQMAFSAFSKTSQRNGLPENRKTLIHQKCRSFQVPSQNPSHLKRAKPGDLSLCLPFNTRVLRGKISSWECLRPKFRGGKIFAFLSCYLSTVRGPETS